MIPWVIGQSHVWITNLDFGVNRVNEQSQALSRCVRLRQNQSHTLDMWPQADDFDSVEKYPE